jgi:hypothetical protein
MEISGAGGGGRFLRAGNISMLRASGWTRLLKRGHGETRVYQGLDRLVLGIRLQARG